MGIQIKKQANAQQALEQLKDEDTVLDEMVDRHKYEYEAVLV